MLENDIELSKFNDYIDFLLKRQMQHQTVEKCPYCNSKKFIKHGKYLGVQRFKCKDCNKTFSLRTNTVYGYSKKSSETWIRFIEFFIEKQTLRYCAKELDISLTTAFYWRHKILSAINTSEELKSLEGEVHIAKTLMKENFKGARNIWTSERKNIIVIATIDSKDTMISLPLCKEVWSYKIFNDKVYAKIKKNSYIVPYGDRYLLKIARNHNKEKIKEHKEEIRIKFFNKLVHLWFMNFRGIATKYLEKYLSWFILDNLKKQMGWIQILEYLSSLVTFVKSKDICKI